MSALTHTDKLFFNQTGMDSSRVHALVDETLCGVDDGELYLESCQSEAFSWDDGRLRSASYDAAQGFGLRAVCGESVGFAHATSLDEDALLRAREAVSAVKEGHSGKVSLSPVGTNRLLYDDQNPLPGKSFEDKIKLLQDVDAYVRARDARVHQVSVSLAAEWQAIQIIGAGGFRAADIRPLVRLNVSVVTKQGERIEQAGWGGGGRYAYDALFEENAWQDMADEALNRALIKLESVEAKAGEMSVVLGPGWPAVILHEAIGHGLEGDFNRKKTSAFAGLMGEKIAADDITIVDDGTLEGKRGSITIDDEGTPSQCTTLIENGKLVGLMQDRMNARLMGTISTGNGRRESFACEPYPRMTNTMMMAGSKTPEEIIESVDYGIYVSSMEGGQVDITSGKFVFSASDAYEIEKGKLGRPLKGASLVGSGFEALKHVSMVGNDFALDRGIGMCGKNGQGVPVGVGQPTIRIDDMTVGGSGF